MLVTGTTVLAGAGGNGYMFRYTDAQPWWNPIPINTPRHVGQSVSGMASSPTTVFAGTNTGIYRSTDEGLSWKKTIVSIPPLTIQVLLLFHGTTLYAVTTSPISSALFMSSDEGETWNSTGAFAQPNVFAIAIVGETLYLGRPDGLWKAPVSGLLTSVVGQTMAPSTFTLDQNYPNPFNPATSIRFVIPADGRTTLTVYNILGKNVGTVVDQFLPRGEHVYRFDGTRLSSGVYFYRLESRNVSLVHSMVLMK
jgi:hypothetical protein